MDDILVVSQLLTARCPQTREEHILLARQVERNQGYRWVYLQPKLTNRSMILELIELPAEMITIFSTLPQDFQATM